MKKIMIDAGHGGDDNGANRNGKIFEKDLNLQVAYELKAMLEKNKNFEVGMTRYADETVYLGQRSMISNDWGADIFISLHHNGFNGIVEGFEIYNYTNSIEGNKLAELIGEELDSYNKRRYVGSGLYAGSQKGNYSVLAKTKAIAVLIEPLFIDSADFKKWDSVKIANIIYKGICNYCGVKTFADIEKWKLDIFEKAYKSELFEDRSWITTLNEPMPTWAVMKMLNNAIKKEEQKHLQI